MANDTTTFDPHYWERCYVFRCRKGECPYVANCFAAEAEDHQETKDLVQSLNAQETQGEEKSQLTAAEKVRLEHARRKHPALFKDDEPNSR